MQQFEAQDPNFERRVRDSYGRQPFMALLGAELKTLRPGFCEIVLPYRKELSQQHGFFHGGIVGTLADDAAGYASYTLMEKNASVLTVEYKLNLLAPADGELLAARASVVKPGRTLTVTQADVFVTKGGAEKLCATALTTMMALANRPDY